MLCIMSFIVSVAYGCGILFTRLIEIRKDKLKTIDAYHFINIYLAWIKLTLPRHVTPYNLSPMTYEDTN